MAEIESKLEGTALSVEELLKIPIFTEGAKPQLEKNLGAVALRKFKKGDVIFREGEHGSTAFYILKGKVKVFINTPFSQVATKSRLASKLGFKNLVSTMTSFLKTRDQTEKEMASPKFISIDAPVNLAYNNPIAQLNEGDLFGEMTCLSLYPRSATVVALEDCEMLEMLRNILNVLQRNPEFKKKLDADYRERALTSQLKSMPLFSSVDEAFLNHLKQSVEFISLNEGQVIFKEGDTADAFYIIRRGFVKVSKKMPGGDLVLSYLPRGSFFGEMALIHLVNPHPEGGTVMRNATCAAMDPVELVKVKLKPE